MKTWQHKDTVYVKIADQDGNTGKEMAHIWEPFIR